jgi:hypothetical protein
MAQVPLFIWINLLVLIIASGVAMIGIRRDNKVASARSAGQAVKAFAKGTS